MPTQLQLRRGTTSQNNSFTGAAGEISVDTTLDQIRVHDGSTAGGIKVPATGLDFGVSGNTNPSSGTLSVGTPANVVIRSATGQSGNVIIPNKKTITFKKINTYRPTGSLIYDTNLLNKIKDKSINL